MRRMLTLSLLAGALVIVLPVFGQAADASAPVPLETCAVCHDEVAAAFQTGPHGRAMAKVSADLLARSCATCHGPAAAHVDDPSTENIHRRPPVAACVSCHADRAGGMELATPAHPRNGVECLDCHGPGHADTGVPHQLLAQPRALCGSCHQDKAAAFAQPYAHREVAGNGGVCIDCHTEKAGPFVYPHPPREVDGCVTCHEPHGSVNPRQLKRYRVANLCLECHADAPAFHDQSLARFQMCQSCHAAVHGSNRDPRLISE